LDQVVWHLLAGTRGGSNRLRIIEELLREPMNAQRLANLLGLDYRTVRHHVTVLTKNGLLAKPEGVAYGARIFVSRYLLANLETVQRVRGSLNRRPGDANSSRRPHPPTAGGD